MAAKPTKEIAIWTKYVAYPYRTCANESDWVDSFNCKQDAKEWLIEQGYSNGYVKCMCAIDDILAGYGNTKMQALRDLKSKVQRYGYSIQEKRSWYLVCEN
jgi:hypothetical protein